MKTLFLVRHAHRDTAVPSMNNGLTAKGREQAEAVKRRFEKRFPGKKPLLISSPKKRCVETLKPLAEALEAKILLNDRLLEGYGVDENAAAFEAWWREKAPDIVVACSHGDWIPVFLKRTTDEDLSLKKGGCAEVVLAKTGPRLENVEQEPG